MQQLNNTEFNCDDCKQVFKYENRREMWKNCSGAQAITCTLEDCPLRGEPFASREQLKDHLMNRCVAIDLTCSRCDAVVKRAEIETHQCYERLAKYNMQLKSRVSDLEAEVARLRAAAR